MKQSLERRATRWVIQERPGGWTSTAILSSIEAISRAATPIVRDKVSQDA